MVRKRDSAATIAEASESLFAWNKQDLIDAAGGVIVGDNGYADVFCYDVVKPKNACHTIYHEFGHVISIEAYRDLLLEVFQDIDSDRDTLLRSGNALWSEFIAEAIAYIVEDDEYSFDFKHAMLLMEHWMDKALRQGEFDPYWLAFYCASYIKSPALAQYLSRHEGEAIGAQDFDDDLLQLIANALGILKRQLKRNNYWKIDRKTLCTVGRHINDICD